MIREPLAARKSDRLRRFAPWILMVLLLVPAIWHVVDFEEDLDAEYPRIMRPTFNPLPPAAYRLAEPGDTLDRVMLYMTALTVVMAMAGLSHERGGALWPAAMALAMAGLWYSATPGPTVDGWHGLGWRTIFDSHAPGTVRISIAAAALAVLSIVAWNIKRERRMLREFWTAAGKRGTRALFVVGGIFLILGQFDPPGIEPVGYWPRWSRIAGFMACALGLAVELGSMERTYRRRWAAVALGSAAWLAMVSGGIWVTWYHRPLARFKEVVPGRIYMSAMPTRAGLEIATSRHHFRTIINLFPEHTSQRSPILNDELAFVRDHQINYLSSPADPSEEASTEFLDQTLALANDPAAWPILVHCHGCMDRTPAWVGIYRFVEEGWPLVNIMREIERHRGYRPKASVILLYNRVLPARAGDRYWADPTAVLLRRLSGASLDRSVALEPGESRQVNPEGPSGVRQSTNSVDPVRR